MGRTLQAELRDGGQSGTKGGRWSCGGGTAGQGGGSSVTIVLRPAQLRKPAAYFPQPAQLMPKQNTCLLPAVGGQRAKMSVPRAGRCPGILPLLPGHPPFPCLRHIHTHVLWPGHHPQPELAQGVERSSPGTCTPPLVFSPPKGTPPTPKSACLLSPASARDVV